MDSRLRGNDISPGRFCQYRQKMNFRLRKSDTGARPPHHHGVIPAQAGIHAFIPKSRQ